MNVNELRSLGRVPFARGLAPLRRPKVTPAQTLGLDAEFTKRGKLVSWQLAGARGVRLFEPPLTIQKLMLEASQLVDDQACKLFLFASFWSLAELGHLPVLEQATGLRMFGQSVDADFTVGDVTLRVLDLARFFPGESLASVARSFGWEKKDCPVDFEDIGCDCLNIADFVTYALEDARLARDIYNALAAQFSADLTSYPTAASVAAASYRLDFLRDDYGPPAPSVRRLALLSCHGGRAEAFHRGPVRRCYGYDLKSAYPQAVLDLERMPTPDMWHETERIDARSVGFVEGWFTFPAGELYPCLPINVDGVLVYPLAGFGVFTFDEWCYARSIGAELRVLRAWSAPAKRGDDSLARFESSLMIQRANSTGARRVAAKLAANAVIGKMAQRVRIVDYGGFLTFCRAGGWTVAEGVGTPVEMIRALGFDRGVSLGGCYCPEWTSLVMGRVRARISKLARDSRAVYVHTDSVWTRDKIESPPADLELRERGQAIVVRAMFGLIGKRLAHHGITRDDIALQVIRAIEFGESPPLSYVTKRPKGLRESLRKGLKLGGPLEEVRECGSAWDQKRRLANDGSTAPWNNPLDFRLAREKNSEHGTASLGGGESGGGSTSHERRKGRGRRA